MTLTLDARAFHAAEMTKAGERAKFKQIVAVAEVIQEEADAKVRTRERVEMYRREDERNAEIFRRQREREIERKAEALKRGEILTPEPKPEISPGYGFGGASAISFPQPHMADYRMGGFAYGATGAIGGTGMFTHVPVCPQPMLTAAEATERLAAMHRAFNRS